jgi:predicted transcriptional regulator
MNIQLFSVLVAMRRSQLEIYISILQALLFYGPLKLTKITYKANVNCDILKERLAVLIEKGLVEQRSYHKGRVLYAATPKAKTILSYFDSIKEILPVVEHDYLSY